MMTRRLHAFQSNVTVWYVIRNHVLIWSSVILMEIFERIYCRYHVVTLTLQHLLYFLRLEGMCCHNTVLWNLRSKLHEQIRPEVRWTEKCSDLWRLRRRSQWWPTCVSKHCHQCLQSRHSTMLCWDTWRVLNNLSENYERMTWYYSRDTVCYLNSKCLQNLDLCLPKGAYAPLIIIIIIIPILIIMLGCWLINIC